MSLKRRRLTDEWTEPTGSASISSPSTTTAAATAADCGRQMRLLSELMAGVQCSSGGGGGGGVGEVCVCHVSPACFQCMTDCLTASVHLRHNHQLRLLALSCYQLLADAALRQLREASLRFSAAAAAGSSAAVASSCCGRLQLVAGEPALHQRLLQLLACECRLTSSAAARCLLAGCQLSRRPVSLLERLVRVVLESPREHEVANALATLQRLVEARDDHEEDVSGGGGCGGDYDDEDGRTSSDASGDGLARCGRPVAVSQLLASAGVDDDDEEEEMDEGVTDDDTVGDGVASLDTIKCAVTSLLSADWLRLTQRFCHVLDSPAHRAETLAFLALWTSLVAVRSSLSVGQTRLFAGRRRLDGVLAAAVGAPVRSAAVWCAVLTLCGEVLCYGSTLALQQGVVDEAADAAHAVLRLVRNNRLLDAIPTQQQQHRRQHSGDHSDDVAMDDAGDTSQWACATPVDHELRPAEENGSDSAGGSAGGDGKMLPQRTVLLVLKALAVTVKEARCDSSSSNSSDGDELPPPPSSRLASSTAGVTRPANISTDAADAGDDWRVIERSLFAVVRRLDAWIKQRLSFHPQTPLCQWAVQLMSERDDALVETLLCITDIGAGLPAGSVRISALAGAVCPHTALLQFVDEIRHDVHVLLDLLLSNETCFLLYLLRALKHVRHRWRQFVAVCGGGGGDGRLDAVMTLLIRLRLTLQRLVERQLFPYNVAPLVRLLQRCEMLYESNEVITTNTNTNTTAVTQLTDVMSVTATLNN